METLDENNRIQSAVKQLKRRTYGQDCSFVHLVGLEKNPSL